MYPFRIAGNPFHHKGKISIIKSLISLGANVSTESKDGYNLLHMYIKLSQDSLLKENPAHTHQHEAGPTLYQSFVFWKAQSYPSFLCVRSKRTTGKENSERANFSFQIFVCTGISDVQFGQQIHSSFFNVGICFAEYFDQLIAFALEKKWKDHGIR